MHQQRKWKGVLFMLLTVVLATGGVYAILAGVSRTQSSLAAPAAPNDVTVAIYDFYFDPPDVTISPGTTVLWYNWGDVAHTVNIPGVVTSGPISPGSVFSHTFNVLGTFKYSDTSYPDMQASVTVVDANKVPIDLGVVAWHDELVSAGARIDYHIEYQNLDQSFGTSEASLTVMLPSGSNLVTSKKNGNLFPPAVHQGQTLVYNLGTVAPYDSGVIDLVIDLPNTLKVNDPVVLTASISAVNPDPYPDNNYAEDSEAVPGANMTISKRPSYDSGPFVPGGVVTYTVEYYNEA
jgi:plastocyanin